MFDLDWPSSYGQENDPPCPPSDETPPVSSEKKRRRRSDALMLSEDEARHVRVAIRKLRRMHGSFAALSAMTGIPASTLRRASGPESSFTGTLAIRIAAAAKVPVEVLLGGKMVVTTPIIGRAA